MYVIKSWARDFRDEDTRRNDWSCYKEYNEIIIDRVFLIIPIKQRVGKKGTFIKDRVIHTYSFDHMGLMFKIQLAKCRFGEDFVEVAYIPDTKEEYNILEKVAKDVIKGKYGNYPYREKKLNMAGYDYFKVQSFVNYLMNVYNLFTKKDWMCNL